MISVGAFASTNSEPVTQTPYLCASWQATSDSAWLKIGSGAWDWGGGAVQYSLDNNPTPQTRSAILKIGNQTQTVIQDASPVVVTSPFPGSTLRTAVQQFNWTASYNQYNFHYEISTVQGAANIASGTTFSGSVRVNNLPINGSPIYFRLWVFKRWGLAACADRCGLQYLDGSHSAIRFRRERRAGSCVVERRHQTGHCQLFRRGRRSDAARLELPQSGRRSRLACRRCRGFQRRWRSGSGVAKR